MIEIRPYKKGDAEAIASLIQQSLIEISSKDYPNDVIEKMLNHFTPYTIEINTEKRETICATIQGKVVGTVSLEGDTVYTLFVHPNYQNKGIGKKLMNYVENMAKEKGVQTLKVPSSITALHFYKQLGYKEISKIISEESGGLIILMQKKL